MTLSSLISMILILTVIVGGFAYFLSIAIRNENSKKNNG